MRSLSAKALTTSLALIALSSLYLSLPALSQNKTQEELRSQWRERLKQAREEKAKQPTNNPIFPSKEESLSINGQIRTYRIYVPTDEKKIEPIGLILDFHGGGGTGHHAEASHNMNAVAKKYNFIVAYPDGLKKRWNDGRPNCPDDSEDLSFVNTLIDTLSSKYKIKPRHVFSCGISNGALFSNHLALKMSNKIGAIASVAGAIVSSDQSLKPREPVSVLLFHGTEDTFVPFKGGEIKGAKVIGGQVYSNADTFSRWQNFDGGVQGEIKTNKIISANFAMKGFKPIKLSTPISITTTNTKSGAKCINVVIENGGHTWPGHPDKLLFGIDGATAMNIDATEFIGRFFAQAASRL